jgi:hypothetical protein
LLADINVGKYLLYLVYQPADGKDIEETFFCLGIVDRLPVYEEEEQEEQEEAGEALALWVHTADFVCSEDARFPQSLQDAYFHSKTTISTEDGWTNIWGASVIVLGIFDKAAMKGGNYLSKKKLERAHAILRYYKNEYPYVDAFMSQDPTNRVTTKRKPKRKRWT